MTFLIGQLAVWLLLTAAFAGLAGWAYAALKAQPVENAAHRERERLLRDLLTLSVDNVTPAGAPVELDRELDTLRRRADLDAARVAEMERALAGARDRAQEAQGRVAELERELARRDEAAAAEPEPVQAAVHVVDAAPVNSEEAELQHWRARYLEHRVRYLEGLVRDAEAPAPEPEPVAAPVEVEAAAPDPVWQWRARLAEARVAHLEDEQRAAPVVEAPIVDAPALEPEEEAPASPFAANVEADMLLRWRMLYLEKRAAFLQAAQAEAPAEADAAEAERWQWRARYLEARTRHLEEQLDRAKAAAVIAPQAVAAPMDAPVIAPEPVAAVEEAPAMVRAPAGERPPGLPAARNGAGDDLSLIEGVSLLQHSTLNSLGIHHFDQIAAWSAANVAWVDQYLRLRGRIEDEEWVEQAQELAEHGPLAARRAYEEEPA